MSRTRHAAYLGAARFVGMAISFLSVPLFLRWLGVEQFGAFVFVQALSRYAAMVDSGFSTAANRLMTRSHAVGDDAGLWRAWATNLRACLGVGVIGAIVLLAIGAFVPASGLADKDHAGLLFGAAAVGFVFETFSNAARTALTSRQLFPQLAAIQGVAQLLGALAALSTVCATRHAAALFAGPMTIAAVVGASTVWLVRRDATAHSKSLGLDRGILKSMWSFVRRSYPNHVLGIVASTADRVLIEKAVGAAPLAGYAVASRIPEVISSLLQPIQETMQPLLSRAHVLGEREFAAQVARATRMALAVGCGFIFVPCGFAEPLLKLWLRDQYVPDLAPIVAGIALYRAFEFYNLSVLLSFIAAGEPGRATPTSIWNAVTTAALSFPVALHFGLPGIVVMNVIIQVQFVPLTWVLFRMVIPDGPLRSQLVAAAGILAISGASAAGAWALAGVEVIARWPWLALVAAPVWSAATVLVFARLGLTPLPSSLARWAGKLGAASENRREAGDGC